MEKIAILVAVYNGELYLSQQLDSLLDQSYSNIHVYIHDDGSKDGSVKLIQEYLLKYPDRFTVLEYPSTGSACANFMSMLRFVREPYVMFCDQDDVWMPNKVERVYQEMRRIEGAFPSKPCLVFSDLYVVDDKLSVISSSFMEYTGRNPYDTDYKSLIMKNVAPGCTMLLNRMLINMVSQCKDIRKIGMHDAWVILIASLKGKICFVHEPLSKYRQHQGNVVGAQSAGVFHKIVNQLVDFFSGEQGRKKQEWLDGASKMAQVLIDTITLNQETREVLLQLALIRRQPKNKRIKFYYQNGFIRRKRWWLAFWV